MFDFFDAIQKKKGKLNLMPARLDFWQSASGLFLAMFMIGHMFLVSSILVSKEFMYDVTQFLELSFIFEGGESKVVSVVAIFILVVIMAHAMIALKKFPRNWREYKRYKLHMDALKHPDTGKWIVQISTGFFMFFLISVHLYILFSQADKIGPYASSDRVYSDFLWPLYLMLLIAVELHLSIGLYRLSIKWGWFDGDNPRRSREILKKVKVFMSIFFISLGILTLLAYMKIGYEHQDKYGERYKVEASK